MTHLGTLVSALADGQLAPAATERALGHVAACDDCAADLAAARASRRALAAAFDVPVDPDLTRRLIALGAEACEPARRESDRITVGSVPLPGSQEDHRLPVGCLVGDLNHRRRIPGRWLVVATTGVGVVAASLFVLGEQPDVVPAAHPAHALTVLGRAATTMSSATAGDGRAAAGADVPVWTGTGPSDEPSSDGRPSQETPDGESGQAPWADATAVVRLTDAEHASGPIGSGTDALGPAEPSGVLDEPTQEQVSAWIAERGWVPPATLPPTYRVAALRLGAEGPDSLEVDLAGERGVIVVTLRHGRLDPDGLATTDRIELEEGTLHVLSTAPWHGVWQSGDAVVSVVAEVPSEALEDVVKAYPVREYDAGPTARIARGWSELAGAWSP